MRILVLLQLVLTAVAVNAQDVSIYDRSQAELIAILRPHVVSLDRDLVLFRYEAKDPQRFNPRVQQDLINREYPWSKRFFNEQIIANPDGGGPGLYTSTDPTATATWGMSAPGLFVLKLKKDSHILLGEMDDVTESEQHKLAQIYKDMACGENVYKRSPLQSETTFSDVITQFRNAKNRDCRHMIIGIFEQLKISAITYPFYSSPLENCRATGTAINIVWPDAMALTDINYYSDDTKIEGNPSLTPFVKKLFNEGKDYFFTNTVMADDGMREKLKNAFGLFPGIEDVDATAYENWKAQHILRCGAKWPTEQPDFRAITNLNGKWNADRDLQDLLAKVALAYRQRQFLWSDSDTPGAEPEISMVDRMRAIENYLYQQLHVSADKLPRAIWKEMKEEGNFEATAKFDDFFGEKFPKSYRELNSKLVAGLEQFDSRYYKHPALMAFAAQKAGLGPRYSMMLFNINQFSHGNVPLLDGDLPTDPNQDVSALLAHNRQLFTSILKQCLAIYSDKRISNKEVFEGPCGVVNTWHLK